MTYEWLLVVALGEPVMPIATACLTSVASCA